MERTRHWHSPRISTMKTFRYTCVTLQDFCKEVGFDYAETMECLCNSEEVSFGNNDDTLLTIAQLCDICDKDVPAHIDDTIRIALGS